MWALCYGLAQTGHRRAWNMLRDVQRRRRNGGVSNTTEGILCGRKCSAAWRSAWGAARARCRVSLLGFMKTSSASRFCGDNNWGCTVDGRPSYISVPRVGDHAAVWSVDDCRVFTASTSHMSDVGSTERRPVKSLLCPIYTADADADATQHCRVESRRRRRCEHNSKLSSPRLPTDSVDNLESEQRGLNWLREFWSILMTFNIDIYIFNSPISVAKQ